MVPEYGWPTSRQTNWWDGTRILRILDAFHRLWLIMLDVTRFFIDIHVRAIMVTVFDVHVIVATVQIERVDEAEDS